jgi:hypothetical protein
MNRAFVSALSACLALVGCVAVYSVAAQDRTAQPGQPTQARVWIQNQGDVEAVPVSIQTMSSGAPPLRVQVVGTPTVLIGAATGQARAGRQVWEYQNLTIPAGQDPTALLNAAGGDGWETTGLTLAVQGGTVLVMKRPR